MTRIQAVRQRFAHEAWAMERILDGVSASGKPAGDVTTLLGHIVLSAGIWRARLEGKDRTGEALWPDWSLEECRHRARSQEKAWRDYLEALTDSGLDESWEWGTREGLSFVPRVGDVLEHVLAHAAHHRGQIARLMREAGGVPVNTDYLNFLRDEPGFRA